MPTHPACWCANATSEKEDRHSHNPCPPACAAVSLAFRKEEGSGAKDAHPSSQSRVSPCCWVEEYVPVGATLSRITSGRYVHTVRSACVSVAGRDNARTRGAVRLCCGATPAGVAFMPVFCLLDVHMRVPSPVGRVFLRGLAEPWGSKTRLRLKTRTRRGRGRIACKAEHCPARHLLFALQDPDGRWPLDSSTYSPFSAALVRAAPPLPFALRCPATKLIVEHQQHPGGVSLR